MMGRYLTDALLWLAAFPVLFVRELIRAQRRYRYYRIARAEAVACECGADIELEGLWRCRCGFTYRGHLLRPCPICGMVPRVVRCHTCTVTMLIPEG